MWRFYLSSILSDISATIPVLLWLPIASNIFFHHFTFSLYVSLNLKWVSCRQGIVESYFSFFIHSTTLCLLMGEFNLFTFKVIIDREDLLLLQCCFLLVLYKYTSEIFCLVSDHHHNKANIAVKGVKWFFFFFGFSVHAKVTFTLWYSLLSVQKHYP